MQPGSEYSAPYYPPHHAAAAPSHPAEFVGNPIPQAFASAPPYSHYSSAEFPPSFASSYPPQISQNPEPAPGSLPPAAPSFPQLQPQTQMSYSTPAYLSPQAEQPSPAVSTYPHLQQPPAAPSFPYYPYDHQQPAPNYAATPPPTTSTMATNPNPYPSYENPYENTAASRFDHGGGGYFSEGGPGRYGSGPDALYGRSRSGFEHDSYEKKTDNAVRYDRTGSYDDVLGDGVYAYDGGRSEPYGARGTAPARSSSSSSSWMVFDDYGRSVGFSPPAKEQVKVVRAVPKAEAQQDVKHGVQKFRVKLLPEGSGQSVIDVLCQIGLDGIRMLDPSTSRTLRIYPLETVTRSEVVDSSTFTFWSKSSVDIEPRRIRLQSNSYTTNTLLDTVTAATIQFKEMDGKDGIGRNRTVSDTGKQPEQPTEKKKGLTDWINMMKPANEEKDHWVPDEAATKCTSCGTDFGAFVRRHHCRNCGDIFCDKCTNGRIALTSDEQAQPVRVCDRCMAEVTQRLSNAKEMASRSALPQSHEDLARKLQEEMDKNRKASGGGSKTSDGSGRRMREVACPTCTVHLQVQVPSSGSATVECGVCQHPFLVNAN
uniref:Arrestin domain-containing protein A n=1 Tax=Anthurium amnicola TaxID=1678845 RepID=A0A1D1YQ44_9ARAE